MSLGCLDIPFFAEGYLYRSNVEEVFSDGKSSVSLRLEFFIPSKGLIKCSMTFNGEDDYFDVLKDFLGNGGMLFKLYFTCSINLSCNGEPEFSLVSYRNVKQQYSEHFEIEKERSLDDEVSEIPLLSSFNDDSEIKTRQEKISFVDVFKREFKDSLDRNLGKSEPCVSELKNPASVVDKSKASVFIARASVFLLVTAGILGCIFQRLG